MLYVIIFLLQVLSVRKGCRIGLNALNICTCILQYRKDFDFSAFVAVLTFARTSTVSGALA